MTAPGGFAPYDQAHVTWEDDGGVTLRTASHNHGQGHETTFAQIVSRRARHPDGEDPPAHRRARFRPDRQPDRRLAHAARPGQRDVLGLAGDREERHGARRRSSWRARRRTSNLLPGSYRIKGTDREVSIDDAGEEISQASSTSTSRTARKCPATFPERLPYRRGGDRSRDRRDPRSSPTSPATTPATSSTTRSSKARCRAASRRAPGHIFGEQAVYDASDGQLLTGSFMDYAMPRAGLVGGLTVIDHAVPTATNPLGAKGVGEGGVTGSMPCLMNAVIDALRQAGVKRFDMPASQQRVWAAIQAAKRRQAGSDGDCARRHETRLRFTAVRAQGGAVKAQPEAVAGKEEKEIPLARLAAAATACALLAALPGVAALIFVLLQRALFAPAAEQITQEDIDAAVQRSLETVPIPSHATKAYEAVRGSIVRVRAFIDGPDGGEIEAQRRHRRGDPRQGRDPHQHPRRRGREAHQPDLLRRHGVRRARSSARGPRTISRCCRRRRIPDDLQAATLQSTSGLRAGRLRHRGRLSVRHRPFGVLGRGLGPAARVPLARGQARC